MPDENRSLACFHEFNQHLLAAARAMQWVAREVDHIRWEQGASEHAMDLLKSAESRLGKAMSLLANRRYSASLPKDSPIFREI
jgi:hypothetical protein